MVSKIKPSIAIMKTWKNLDPGFLRLDTMSSVSMAVFRLPALCIE